MEDSATVSGVLSVSPPKVDPATHYTLYLREQDSLSVILSNLEAQREGLLRTFIEKKAAGNHVGHTGSVSALDFSIDESNNDTICYYVSLTKPAAVAVDVSEDLEATSTLQQEFIVCFLTSEILLELYRQELDSFCFKLLPLMDTHCQSSEAITELMRHLQNWQSTCVQFMTRCIERFDKDIAVIIYAAVMGFKLDVCGGDIAFHDDVYRFLDACSLADYIDMSTNDKDKTQSSEDLTMNPSDPEIISLIIDKETHHFDLADYPEYFDQLTMKIVSVRDSPYKAKQVLENFKLAVLQEINMFRRQINKAENDYYALYRAFVFLQQRGYNAVILRYTKNFLLSNSTAMDVIKVLEEFLADYNRS